MSDLPGNSRPDPQAEPHADELNALSMLSLLRLAEATRVFVEIDPDLPTLLHVVARHVAMTFGGACVIRLLDTAGQMLLPGNTYHPDPARYAEVHSMLARVPQGVGMGLLGQVALTGKALLLPVVTPEFLRALTDGPHPAALAGHSCLIVPLRVRGRGLTGVLCAVRDHARAPYRPEDQLLL